MDAETILKNRKIIIGILIGVLILGFVSLKFASKKTSKPEEKVETEEVLPESEDIPSVDESVKVKLKAVKGGREVLLTVDNIPDGTSEIEYELSYIASGDLPKGVIGTIKIDGDSSIERQITLGTCSAGTCVYDEGVESVSVSLKFNGDYGSQIFEKEFDI